MTQLRTILFSLLALAAAGCASEKPAYTASSPSPTKTPTRSFVPPTAEEAYRLQDDCTLRGQKILRDNVVGIALTQEQVSRYNPTTNRCYVRLEVHAKDLTETQKYDWSTYLYDGQTTEILAFRIVHATSSKASGDGYLGFGCNDASCVSEKIADCMNGKDCEPQ